MTQRKKPVGGKSSGKTQRRSKRSASVAGSGEQSRPTGPAGDLLDTISDAATYDHPLPLLELGSSILSALDPRVANPFRAAGQPVPGQEGPDRPGFINTLLGTPLPETLMLLAVIHALSSDDLERARISRTLRAETAEAEGLLAEFASLAPYRATEMTHVLGDGDNVLLGVRTPDGDEFTLVIYIDHNMGTIVKDAFTIPEAIGDVIATMKGYIPVQDTTWTDLSLPDARAKVQQAIDQGASTPDAPESEQWPGIRPLTETVLRQVPDGGTGYARPEWSRQQLDALADTFLASRYPGALSEDGNSRGLLENILWFATDYGPGDPMRWSPTSVSILLLDWIPRKILAPAAVLRVVPDLLRGLVRYCHAERGISAKLSRETLASLAEAEPEFRRLISGAGRRSVPADDDGWGLDDDSRGRDHDSRGFDGGSHGGIDAMTVAGFQEMMLEIIAGTVGGEDQLDKLNDVPLPDEDFDWRGIPEDIQGQVTEVLRLCDSGTELLDAEHRTAARRFLARAAAGDPAVFRRRTNVRMSAAAVCWIIAKANDSFGSSGLYVKDLMKHFGVSSASQRAQSLLAAAGIDRRGAELELGTPDLLVSAFRTQLITMRDSCRAALAGEALA
ncbi:hypothetical protein IV498_00125 [Paenarthrobacter sp. Z7-10]|uniref:DUF6398 domain-containing protein n=1 Tax=Paenarthrobacter sp. Z7-10 TaxID=2787635 RepID=UPI0022A99129|nr:hypothetical protein [Paenarthrobacter sp. Z7-10]MCZ2401629.1 hypothetical protein [Paenarthrobacter sp. Z7-10]